MSSTACSVATAPAKGQARRTASHLGARAASSPEPGSARSRRTRTRSRPMPITSSESSRDGSPLSPQGGDRLRKRGRQRDRPGRAGPPRDPPHGPFGRAGRSEHKRRLRLDRPEPLKKAVVDSRAALGVALDGDADRVLAVDHTGTLVDGDQLHGHVRLRSFGPWPAHRWVDRRDGHEQPGPSPGPCGERDRGRRDAGRGPLCHRRHRSQRAPARRRAVRPYRVPPPRPHRRRSAHGPAAFGARGPHGPPARRPGGGGDVAAPPGAGERARGRPGPPRFGPRGLGRGRLSSRPSSATPAGCSCVPQGPRRWCGSWPRRPPTRWPSNLSNASCRSHASSTKPPAATGPRPPSGRSGT